MEVVAPDPSWPVMFAKEAWRIAGEVGDLAFAIHHIGSTSIAGIYAKPVIDILLEASTGEALDGLGARMAHVGYQGLGEFGISGRRYFRKDDSLGTRTHQVHAFLKGDVHVHRHLAFRDYLCAHEGVAQAYSTLKRELADHCHDMAAYMDGKAPFIQEHLEKAMQWWEHR